MTEPRPGPVVRRFLGGVGYGVMAVLTLFILLGNLRLYAPADDSAAKTVPADAIVPHLCFLGSALRAGAGTEMQRLFPEGFVFTHALYGLSWCELARTLPVTDARQTEARAEAAWSLRQLESDTGRRPFTANVEPSGGIFYAGWCNWLRGKTLQCGPADTRDPALESSFQRECKSIARAFQQSPTPFLAAYPGQAWPVDSTARRRRNQIRFVGGALLCAPELLCGRHGNAAPTLITLSHNFLRGKTRNDWLVV